MYNYTKQEKYFHLKSQESSSQVFIHWSETIHVAKKETRLIVRFKSSLLRLESNHLMVIHQLRM